MTNYLETIYFRDEQSENDYPQKLCDYLIKNYIGASGVLLDIGSGKGNHLTGFARRGFDVYGLDMLPECIEATDYDVRFCNLEKDSFPFEDNKFDVVYTKSVIEHVFNADNFLAEALRVLKKDGIAIIMAPDWGSHYKIFWDDYLHIKPWTRKSLQDAMVIKGFSDVKSILFRQLPILWKYPCLKPLSDLTSLLPDSLKWKDKEEKYFNAWIRFSKEKMILATGTKK